MASLGDIRDKLRHQVLNVSTASYYDSADLLEMVTDASREIAAAFRFPVRPVSGSLPAGTIAMDLPSGGLDVVRVSVGGLAVTPRSWSYVKFLQALPPAPFPRGYYFDMLQYGSGIRNVQVGPPVLATSSYEALYVRDVYEDAVVVSTNTEVWMGEHESFHDLALLRGAVKAFDMKFELSDSAYYLSKYQQRTEEFAQYLGMAIPEALMPSREARRVAQGAS